MPPELNFADRALLPKTDQRTLPRVIEINPGEPLLILPKTPGRDANYLYLGEFESFSKPRLRFSNAYCFRSPIEGNGILIPQITLMRDFNRFLVPRMYSVKGILDFWFRKRCIKECLDEYWEGKGKVYSEIVDNLFK